MWLQLKGLAALGFIAWIVAAEAHGTLSARYKATDLARGALPIPIVLGG